MPTLLLRKPQMSLGLFGQNEFSINSRRKFRTCVYSAEYLKIEITRSVSTTLYRCSLPHP
jgi:hypothetical protein